MSRRRRQLWAILGIALTAITSACTKVGPDFTRPEARIRDQWELIDPAEVDASPAEIVEWWTLFDDPVLNELVQRAYEQNYALEAAGLRVLEARAQLGLVGGTRYPQLQTFGGGATYLKTSEKAANTAGTDTSYLEFNLGVNVAWEIDFWGKFRRGVESANAGFLASIASYESVLVLLIAQVVDTYTVIRATEEQLRISRENVALQQRSFEITQTLFENGHKSELDVQQAKALLYSTESTIPALQNVLEVARNALSILLAQPPGDLESVLGTTSRIPQAPAEVAVGIPADLLRRRPDIRQAELRAAAQSARIGVAKAELYPSFSLFGSLGLVSATSSEALLGGNALQVIAGPMFSWKIFNYGRLKNSVRVQDARFQQSVVAYQNAVLNAAREVQDAISGFVRNRQQKEKLLAAVAASDRSVELSTLQYQQGMADFQRVLLAQQSLFGQQQRLASSRRDTVRSVIALYKALGGGWEIRMGREFIDEETADAMRERTNWGKLLEPGRIEPATSESEGGEAQTGSSEKRDE